jgi:PPOX class probable F420-dependent enzyme
MDLEQVTFVALETFKKSGEGKVTPTWVTGKDGKLYIWTDLESWKVKRIRNNPQVRICQSDAMGNPKGEWFDAQAKVLDTDQARQKARQLFLAKYRLQFRLFAAFGRKTPKAILEITGR